jgi:hypothetical protein
MQIARRTRTLQKQAQQAQMQGKLQRARVARFREWLNICLAKGVATLEELMVRAEDDLFVNVFPEAMPAGYALPTWQINEESQISQAKVVADAEAAVEAARTKQQTTVKAALHAVKGAKAGNVQVRCHGLPQSVTLASLSQLWLLPADS